MDGPVLLFESLYGSRAFGLAREGSDEDLRGVVAGPRAWYFGTTHGPEQIELGKDHVRYELRKFLRLAVASNPAAIELLHVDPNDYRHVHPAFERVLAARSHVLSKRVAETFSGYALGQLARIDTHRRWLLDPPPHEPVRADFDLPKQPLVTKDQFGAAEAMLARDETARDRMPVDFLTMLDRERAFRSAVKRMEQYRQWLATRNEARAALEKRFGYDTKHAMHLVRLLRMAGEILREGVVHVRRADRDELLAIRDGALSYEALREHAATLDADVRAARVASRLPDEVDAATIDALAVDVLGEVLR